MPPLSLGLLAIGECIQHERLVVERVNDDPGQGDQRRDGDITAKNAFYRGQEGFLEYGFPNTASSCSRGFSVRSTTSSESPSTSRREKSR